MPPRQETHLNFEESPKTFGSPDLFISSENANDIEGR